MRRRGFLASVFGLISGLFLPKQESQITYQLNGTKLMNKILNKYPIIDIEHLIIRASADQNIDKIQIIAVAPKNQDKCVGPRTTVITKTLLRGV